MVIRGKGKSGFIDSSSSNPRDDDPNYQSWDIQNSMVMAWRIHSMEESMETPIYFIPLWRRDLGLCDAGIFWSWWFFSKYLNYVTESKDSKQGDTSIAQFFNTLKKIWQKLDHFNKVKWKGLEDAVLHQKIVARERVHDFLAGLNKKLDEIRGRILGSKHLLAIHWWSFCWSSKRRKP